MIARFDSARIVYGFPRTLKVLPSVVFVLSFYVRMAYGSTSDLLFEAVRSGEVSKVRAALSQGADVDGANRLG